jgi:hypothetical protein
MHRLVASKSVLGSADVAFSVAQRRTLDSHVTGGTFAAALGVHDPPLGLEGPAIIVWGFPPTGQLGVTAHVCAVLSVAHAASEQVGSRKNDTVGAVHVTSVASPQVHPHVGVGAFEPTRPVNAVTG